MTITRCLLAAICAAPTVPAQQLGALLASFPTPAAIQLPLGMAFDAASGNLLIGDFSIPNTLWVVDPVGNVVNSFPLTATSGARGITTDGTNIYVGDAGGNGIDIYTMTGTFVSTFSTQLTVLGPTAITWNANDNRLYVIDDTFNHVDMFTTTGIHLGNRPCPDRRYFGITYDAANDLYWATEGFTRRMSLLDTNFNEILSYSVTSVTGGEAINDLTMIGDTVVGCSRWGFGVYFLEGSPSAPFPPELSLTVEAAPNTGTLTTAPQRYFRDGDHLRWHMRDQNGITAGTLCAVIANIGDPTMPIGSTTWLPGFNQLWSGSTPSGLSLILPPYSVGSSHSLLVPPGIVGFDTTLRLQGLTLEPSLSPTPALATAEVLSLQARTCVVEETFDNLTPGPGNIPAGWSNGAALLWGAGSGPGWLQGTGPTSATTGSVYMMCDILFSGTLGPYVMNTAPVSAAGINHLAFDLSRLGGDIGTLEIRQGDGSGTFTGAPIATFTGPVAVEWESVSIPLAITTANVDFQFSYTAANYPYGDLAIDSFCLH